MATRPLFNYTGDPFNADAIASYPRIQTAYYSGPYDNFTAPASPNFPLLDEDVIPARYFLYLPFIPDISNLGDRPLLVRDVTNSVTLTKVTGSPTANQYRIAPANSKTPEVIELNAAQAGVTIGIDAYATGTVQNEYEIENPILTTISNDVIFNGITDSTTKDTGSVILQGGLGIEKNIVAGGYCKTTLGYIQNKRTYAATNSDITYLLKIQEIGLWDMDASATQTVSHGIDNIDKIIGARVLIVGDVGVNYIVPFFESITINTTDIVLTRSAGGIFDNVDFNSTSRNRGYVLIDYWSF